MVNNIHKIDTSILSIAKDLIRYIPSIIIPALGMFLGVAIFTRLLDPKEYGYYVLVMTTVTLIESICFRWLKSSSLRYFEEYNKNNNTQLLMSTSIIAYIFTFIIVLTIYYTTSFYLKGIVTNEFIYLLRIGGIVLIADVSYQFALIILVAQRESLKYSILESIDSIGKVIIAIVFLLIFSSGTQGILWAICIVTGGIFCFELISFNRKWPIKFYFFSKGILKQYLFYGIPLIGASIGMIILNISDRYMLQYFLGPKEVGIYASGYKIIDASMNMLSGLLLHTVTPVIFQSVEYKGENTTKYLIEKFLNIYLIIFIPFVLGITVLSRQITKFLLGKLYQDAYIFLPWVAVGMFFWGLTTCFHKPFEVKQKTKFITYMVLFAAILNIILNCILIPINGSLGAAIATFISYLFCFCITFAISRKFFLIKFPLVNCIKSLLAGSCMFIIVLFFKTKYPDNIYFFIVSIIIGAFSYFIFLRVLKEETSLKMLNYFIRLFKIKFCSIQ